MGNTLVLEGEDQTSSNLNLLNDNLSYVGSKQHKYLGQIQLWKSKSNPQEWVFSKILQIDIGQSFINSQHAERQSMKHQNLLKYYGCTIKEQTFQGTIKEYRIYYEFLSTNLTKFLQNHLQNGQYVKETFIWKLITQISSVFSYLDSKNKYHSNINLDSIFFDEQNNVKILYHGALPNVLSSYAQTLGSYNSNISLSPQQMKDYQNHQAQLNLNPFKQDSYQFGIVLVSLMSGKDVTKCTDFYNEVIHYKQILNILGSSIRYYSQSLLNLVVSLLQYDDSKRPNISKIFNFQIQKQPTIQKQIKQGQFSTSNQQRINTSSYSIQTSRNHYQNKFFMSSPNNKTLSITRNTQYTSQFKMTNSYHSQFSLNDVYVTPKKNQSRSYSQRIIACKPVSKYQSPYIRR